MHFQSADTKKISFGNYIVREYISYICDRARVIADEDLRRLINRCAFGLRNLC